MILCKPIKKSVSSIDDMSSESNSWPKPAQLILLTILFLTTPSPALAAMFTVTGGGTVFGSSDVGITGEAVTFTFSYDPADFYSKDEYQPGLADYFSMTPIAVSAQGSTSGIFDISDLSYVYVNDSIDDIIDEFSFQTFGSRIDFYNLDATAFNGLPQSFEDLHSVFLTSSKIHHSGSTQDFSI